jgi:hypothetical protein
VTKRRVILGVGAAVDEDLREAVGTLDRALGS